MKYILITIFALFTLIGTINAQVVERSVEAIETLQTGVSFIYQGVDIPVLDISYHEWSSDSITWSKTYTEGDCYLRISNDVKTTWVGINVCGGSGTGTSQIDTVIVCSNGVCDTITTGKVTVNIPSPITITGSTGNTQTDTTHTHDIVFYMGDVENVDTSLVVDGYVLKWNATTGTWIGAPDLTGAGASGQLTVKEQDGTPTVSNVNEIRIENGRVTDEGAGAVSIDFSLEPIDGAQDFFRTDTVDVNAGDTFLTFSSPLPAADYIVANAYALYSNGERQSLSYDSITVNGFRVLSVLGQSEVHYLVMRDLDSLGIVVDGIGFVYASGTDATLGYLNQKVDENTIDVVDNKLAFIADTVSVDLITTDNAVINGDSLRATTQLTDADTIIATSAWVLTNIGTANGWDSITKSVDEEYYIWWYGGIKLDSVQRTGIFLEIADSTTAYVTPSQLSDTIANTDGLKTMVFHITLPSAGTLIDRINAATDFPSGWVMTASGSDLQVEHNLNRRVSYVSVWAVTGTEEQQLYNTAAHNGVKTPDADNLTIQSLATSFSSKDIVVYVTFE